MSVEKSIKRYRYDAAEGPGPGQGSHSHLTPDEDRLCLLRMRGACLACPAPRGWHVVCDIWCPLSSMVTQPRVSSLKHRNYETNVNTPPRGQTGTEREMEKVFRETFINLISQEKKEYITCRRDMILTYFILFFRLWIIPFNIVLWTLVQEHE